jgi:putative ABC transport system substrate-binding protein
VAAGLAASLAHPGGNLTGFSGGDIELLGKRVQLLKEALPAVSRIWSVVESDGPLDPLALWR